MAVLVNMMAVRAEAVAILQVVLRRDQVGLGRLRQWRQGDVIRGGALIFVVGKGLLSQVIMLIVCLRGGSRSGVCRLVQGDILGWRVTSHLLRVDKRTQVQACCSPIHT